MGHRYFFALVSEKLPQLQILLINNSYGSIIRSYIFVTLKVKRKYLLTSSHQEFGNLSCICLALNWNYYFHGHWKPSARRCSLVLGANTSISWSNNLPIQANRWKYWLCQYFPDCLRHFLIWPSESLNSHDFIGIGIKQPWHFCWFCTNTSQ